MNSPLLLTVFVLTYLAMAVGRIPGLRTDRAGLALVAERAASVGVRLPFLAHARAGVPITLLTFAIAGLWLWAIGVVTL